MSLFDLIQFEPKSSRQRFFLAGLVLLTFISIILDGKPASAEDATKCAFTFSTNKPIAGQTVSVDAQCPFTSPLKISWIISGGWYYMDHYSVGSGYESNLLPSSGTCGFNRDGMPHDCNPIGLTLYMQASSNAFYLAEIAIVPVGVISLPKNFTNSSSPTVVGTFLSGTSTVAKVGSLLSASSGVWDSGVSFGYQWLRDGVAISGATSSSYTPTAADYQARISVQVTGSKAGYVSVSKTSSDFIVGAGSLVQAPVPVVSGSSLVNGLLSASSGVWDSGVSFGYQWLRDGVAISGATSSSYTPTAADYQARISVQVTGSKAGYVSVSKTSSDFIVGAGSLVQAPVPVVSGSSLVNGLLSASSGVWDSGVSFGYQWLRDGVAISGATSSSYTPTAADYQARISVQVTGSLNGFNSVSRTSDSVIIGSGVPVGLGAPIISGSGSVGSVLTASSVNSGFTQSYQWLRDGVSLGHSGLTYRPGFEDLGSVLSVSGTFSKYGYENTNLSSEGLPVSLSVPNTACSAKVDGSSWLGSSSLQPMVTGSGLFGSTLQGTNGSWSTGTRFCTYWYENGKAIAGAFKSSYKIQPSDIGQQIQYVVVGTDKSGKTALRYSDPITIGNSRFLLAKSPIISGQVRVGSKLSGHVKLWEKGSSYRYQWFRNGSPIYEATLSSYVLSSADIGSSISLKVCGSKEYFDDLCLISDSTTVVGLGVIPSPPASKISGNSTKAGSTLTGSTGNWMSGVQLQTQWLSDGNPIPGATGASYVIQNSDKGHTLAFQVTATADGYQTVVKVSAGKKIP